MNLENLSYEQLRDLVKTAVSEQIIDLLDEIILSDANVFLCKRLDKRFNLKYDFDYGFALEPVDKHTATELIQLKAILERVMNFPPAV